MLRDLRHALHTLGSWRFGALAAIATLAIGIGTATSMYALVRTALNSSTPDIEDLPAIGRIYASSRALGIERSQLTLRDVDLLGKASSFDSVGAYTSDDGEVTVGDQRAANSVGQVSAGLFSAMRAHAAAGRLFSADDFRGGAPVVVVSDRIWRRHYAGRPFGDATATIDGTPRTIVGVLPPSFGFPFIGISADVWVPLVAGQETERNVNILARLKTGKTWPAATAELDAIARPLNPNGLWTWTAITAEQDLNRRSTSGYAMMFGPAFVILLIGCTNVACMLLARGIDRDVELSVRSALGASRGRVMRQLLVENLVLALVGGALGLAVAYALLKAVADGIAQFHPDAAASIVPSATMLLAIAFTFSIGACLLFGMVPAIRLSRRDIVTSLKGGTTPAVARFVGYRARDLVVFVELGLAVALIVMVAMFVRFFAEIERVTPLFPAGQILSLDIPARDARGAVERISALPGVSGVTAASAMPGGSHASSAATLRAGNGHVGRGAVVGIDAAFFRAAGIPVLRGRSFDRAEAEGHQPVAIVSDGAASALWPDEDPIGAKMTVTSRTGTSTVSVIGVARNAIDGGGLARTGLIAPDIYVPLDAKPGQQLRVLVRAQGDPHVLMKPVSLAARPSPSARAPRADLVQTGFVPPDSAFIVELFVGFGLIAMLLAGSGIFGVISQSVAQRTTEFGVRMAMGASPGQVLRMVLTREVKLIVAAIASGAGGTLIVTRFTFVEMLLITGTDPRVWLAIATVCAGVAAVAVTFATYRIVKIDPWKVLRDT